MKSLVRVLVGASCAALVLTLAGCGSGSGGSAADTLPATATATPSADVTGTPAADAVVIAITIDGTNVSPKSESREVKRDQPIVFQIQASQAGQLHVHSSPSQVIDYPEGASAITVSFAIPGIVDVEDHAIGEPIIQFEVN